MSRPPRKRKKKSRQVREPAKLTITSLSFSQSVDLAVDYVLPNVINAGQLHIKTIAECLGEGLSGACEDPEVSRLLCSTSAATRLILSTVLVMDRVTDIETADNSTQNPTQTSSQVPGASGSGFVSNVAASQTSKSGANSSQQSQGAGGTNGASKVSSGLALVAISLVLAFAA